MNTLNEVIERHAAYEEGYEAGKEAGKREVLLQLQSEIHQIAINARANNNESRYDMLNDIDNIISKMLEG